MLKKLFILLIVISSIAKQSQAQIITTVAGGGSCGSAPCGDGGQATAAELFYTTGVTFDAVGNMYISDLYGEQIRKVTTAGIITTIAGTTAGYSGDGGAATNAQLFYPYGITFDAAGNLYIADQNNNRVRIVNTAGIINTFAGNGTSGYSGDGGQATAAELYGPRGVTIDAAGNIYITDYENNRIRVVNTAGIIRTIAGNGTGGYAGDGAAATAAELNYPEGVACDASGNLYIADYSNNRIRIVNTNGIINTFSGNGTAAYSGDGGQASAAELYGPSGVGFDAAGNLYIADYMNARIRKVTTTGIISTCAGDGTGGFSGDGGNAISAELHWPIGLVYNTDGDLYIADYGNERIRKITNIGNTTDIAPLSAREGQGVRLYPNPNNGTFTLQLNEYENTSVEVYNIIGECVYRQPATATTNQINIAGMANGMYQLRVLKGSNLLYQTKLVKQE